jgi:hypothetical protein
MKKYDISKEEALQMIFNAVSVIDYKIKNDFDNPDTKEDLLIKTNDLLKAIVIMNDNKPMEYTCETLDVEGCENDNNSEYNCEYCRDGGCRHCEPYRYI